MSTKERRKFMRIATEMQADYWAKGSSMVNGQGQVRDFSREGTSLAGGVAASRIFDLDDLCPHVSHELGRIGSSDHVPALNDTKAC